MVEEYENDKEPIDPGLRKLYAHMTDDEVREAQRNLRRYAAVILRIRRPAQGRGQGMAETLRPS